LGTLRWTFIAKRACVVVTEPSLTGSLLGPPEWPRPARFRPTA
jgi:hypothetical protein